MSIVTIPANLKAPAECSIGQARYDMTESSEATGNEAARAFGPPRWRMSIASLSAMSLADAGVWEAMVLKLRGRVNHLAAYDFVRSLPQGTLRGAPMIAGVFPLPAGATSATFICSAAGTLKAGDWMQFNTGLGTSQLVKVMADCTSSPASDVAFSWTNGGAFTWSNGGAFSWVDAGTITVTFEPPTRLSFVAGTVATLDKPVAYYKQTSEPRWSYRLGRAFKQGGFALDLLEAFN